MSFPHEPGEQMAHPVQERICTGVREQSERATHAHTVGKLDFAFLSVWSSSVKLHACALRILSLLALLRALLPSSLFQVFVAVLWLFLFADVSCKCLQAATLSTAGIWNRKDSELFPPGTLAGQEKVSQNGRGRRTLFLAALFKGTD